MKIIFLDHFGVMCLANKHGRENNPQDLPRLDEMRNPGGFDYFDKDAVRILNSILENDVEIVVSSDWKRWCNLEEMGQFYLSQGINKVPLEFTPFFHDLKIIENSNFTIQQQRAFEIKYWLKEHPEITYWVAIDDLYLEDCDLKNFVWISRTDEGISQTNVKNKILNFLNQLKSPDFRSGL